MRLCFIYLEFPLSLKKENIYICIFYIAVYKSRLCMYSTRHRASTRARHTGLCSHTLNQANGPIFCDLQTKKFRLRLHLLQSPRCLAPWPSLLQAQKHKSDEPCKLKKVLFDQLKPSRSSDAQSALLERPNGHVRPSWLILWSAATHL